MEVDQTYRFGSAESIDSAFLLGMEVDA